MRRILFFTLPAAALVAVALGGGRPHPVAAQAQFQQVNIRVTCEAGEVDEVSIRPWTARAARTEQLRWRLLPASAVGSATIRPKSTSQWPFASNAPLTVASGDTVDSGAVTGADGSYFYDIIVDCGSGPTTIDPRMDIGGD